VKETHMTENDSTTENVVPVETATQNTEPSEPVDIAASEATPSGPTTSPDVIVVTEDPGAAPEGDAPVDDGTHTDAPNEADPPSTDQAVSVLEDQG
jgi:hypothetical protein